MITIDNKHKKSKKQLNFKSNSNQTQPHCILHQTNVKCQMSNVKCQMSN